MENNLIEIITLEDIDGYFFNRRMDTGQIIYGEDFEIIKPFNSSNNKIPKNANAIFYSKQNIGDSILSANYFCKLNEKPDEGFRRIAKGEFVLPKDYKIKGNYSGGNIDISFAIG